MTFASLTAPLRLCALDIRPRSINAIVGTKRGASLRVERAIHLSTVGLATDEVGAAVIREIGAQGLPTIASLEAKFVLTTGISIEPYIESRDYNDIALRQGGKGLRPTNGPRRTRWRQHSKDRLLLSVADEKAVNDTADLITKWGCKPWIIADPAVVWLETFAPHGIIDDLDGTTLFATVDAAGVIQSDTTFQMENVDQFQNAAIQIIRKAAVTSTISTLSYFGAPARFGKLRGPLLGMGIELLPAVPPNHTNSEPWTYALALATYGAAS